MKLFIDTAGIQPHRGQKVVDTLLFRAEVITCGGPPEAPVNKTDLLQAVALREQIKPGEAERIIDAFLEVISLSLACEEDVTIRNFGRFEHRKRNPVHRRNPRTGAPVDVPSRNTVGFRPAPRLRERVNGKR